MKTQANPNQSANTINSPSSRPPNHPISLYLWLIKINIILSTFIVGGGYVVVPMVKKYYVQKKKLFTEEELMDMTAVAQSTPGAIAINLISLSGYKVAGVMGVVVSCIAAIIPPIVILSIISAFYSAFISNAIVAAVLKGMQAGVAALIVDFIIDMGSKIVKERSVLLDVLVVSAFAVSFFTDINVIFVILASCVICAVHVLIKRKRGDRK